MLLGMLPGFETIHPGFLLPSPFRLYVYICKLRIQDDLKKINSKLSGCFKQMASYMTEIKLHNLDKTKEDNPKLLEFPRSTLYI